MASSRAHRDTAPSRRRSALLVARSHLGTVRASPAVMARLVNFAHANDRVIRETASALSERQLQGRSILPDPLPTQPDQPVTELPSTLSRAERRTLLAASVLVDDRVQTLLATSGVDVRVLRSEQLRHLILIRDGRFERVDEEVRSAVLAAAPPQELRDAHRAAARSLTAANDRRAWWHRAEASTTPDTRLAKHLVLLAQNLFRAGNCEAAVRVAGKATMLSDSDECTASASRTAGLASFWGGWLDDADAWFQRCEQLRRPVTTADGTSATAILAYVRHGADTHADPKEPAHRFIGMISRLDPPAADRRALDDVRHVIATYLTDRSAADEMLAALLLSLSTSHRHWPWDEHSLTELTPLTSAHLSCTEIAFQTQAGGFARASETLLWAAERFPLQFAAWGIVESMSREIAQHSDALDPEVASVFADLVPPRVLTWTIEGEPSGQVTIDAVPPPQENRQPRAENIAVDLSSLDLGYGLTGREKDVLLQASDGSSVQNIATTLGISPRTVEVHLGNIYRKLGVTSRPQLIASLRLGTSGAQDTR